MSLKYSITCKIYYYIHVSIRRRIIKYHLIFVLVVYKNTDDLINFLGQTKKIKYNFKVIIVNNFFSLEVNTKIEEIAKTYDCDYININNLGYGHGNNRGIEYANQNYKYNFLIVSNTDVDIIEFDISNLSSNSKSVYGPLIKTSSNKNQNPYWVYNNKMLEYLIYKGYYKRNKFYLYFGIGINKILRELFILYLNLTRKQRYKVFSLHGSFVIFTRKSLEIIGLPYDEEMFLFAEEAHLAHVLKRNNIKSYIIKNAKIIHLEDGTIGDSDISIKDLARNSVITYYEKLRKRVKK